MPQPLLAVQQFFFLKCHIFWQSGIFSLCNIRCLRVWKLFESLENSDNVAFHVGL